MPNFGVSTAILNRVDIFRRWCKLSFRPLDKRIDARRQYFLLFVQISWNNWLEATWTILLVIDFDLLLPFKRIWIRLGHE